MIHKCRALIIDCIDFRLTKSVFNWAKKLHLENDYDLLNIGGSSKEIANPEKPEYRELILKNIDISINLHEVKKIYIIHHEDCGAYGGKEAFKSDEEELQQHSKDMETSKKIILDEYKNKNLEVIKVFERLDDTFEVIK